MWPRGSRLDWAIALPLLLFALYGTNVPLPFATHRWTWLVLVVVSVTWAVGVWAWMPVGTPRRGPCLAQCAR